MLQFVFNISNSSFVHLNEFISRNNIMSPLLKIDCYISKSPKDSYCNAE